MFLTNQMKYYINVKYLKQLINKIYEILSKILDDLQFRSQQSFVSFKMTQFDDFQGSDKIYIKIKVFFEQMCYALKISKISCYVRYKIYILYMAAYKADYHQQLFSQRNIYFKFISISLLFSVFMKLLSKKSTLRKTRSKKLPSLVQTDVESSYSESFYFKEKKNKKKKIIKKKTDKQKNNQKVQMLHQRIYRFRLPRAKQTLRVYCYNEQDLKWHPRFTKKLCNLVMDNDQDSDDDIIQQQIQNGRQRLLQGISQCRASSKQTAK